ncbi:MAG: NAD-dependent epimerase/dehydratase, partial [Cytophagaceae bacterium]|nr:NAD-dependent epimerase/dehydratase [Gemmatimonadaceae bacterium]
VRAASSGVTLLTTGAATVAADLEAPGAATAIVDAERPSHVFNLAGYGVDRGEADEVRAEQLNHLLPRELAAACAPRGNASGPVLVHVGSAAEYGSVGGTFTESGDARPFTTYGRTKLAGTRAVSEVAVGRGTRALTARLFTVFGEGEHEGRLFPSLVAAAAAGGPIDLSDGRQRRDFAFVGDVADALIALGDLPVPPGDVVNVASGQLHTVEAFVRAAAVALGMPESHLRFGTLPTRNDEMAHDGVSVDRMRSRLGHALTADLDDMVRRAIADSGRPA